MGTVAWQAAVLDSNPPALGGLTPAWVQLSPLAWAEEERGLLPHSCLGMVSCLLPTSEQRLSCKQRQ